MPIFFSSQYLLIAAEKLSVLVELQWQLQGKLSGEAATNKVVNKGHLFLCSEKH